MREIRFRAWDKESKEMVTNPIVSSFDWNKGSQGGTHDTLMQSTGVHERRGVEIWEGDIVKKSRRGPNWVVEWNGTRARYVFRSGRNEFALSNASALKYLEVVGNVYENPELIEKA